MKGTEEMRYKCAVPVALELPGIDPEALPAEGEIRIEILQDREAVFTVGNEGPFPDETIDSGPRQRSIEIEIQGYISQEAAELLGKRDYRVRVVVEPDE